MCSVISEGHLICWTQTKSIFAELGEMVLPSDLPFYSKEEKVEYAMVPQVYFWLISQNSLKLADRNPVPWRMGCVWPGRQCLRWGSKRVYWWIRSTMSSRREKHTPRVNLFYRIHLEIIKLYRCFIPTEGRGKPACQDWFHCWHWHCWTYAWLAQGKVSWIMFGW